MVNTRPCIRLLFVTLASALLGMGSSQTPIRFLFAPAAATGLAPYGAAIADLDGDGDSDAVTADYGDGEISTVSILINLGGGTFAPPASYSVGDGAVEVKLGDFNGDGRPDMVTANSMTGQNFGTSSYCTVLINNGNGTFGNRRDYNVGFNSYCRGVEVADFDSDGKLDWAAAAMADGNLYVYRGLGNGQFVLRNVVPADSPSGLVAADFNRDGRPDIAYHTVNDLYVMLNLGTSFAAPVYYSNWPANVSDLAVGDFNKDGAPDLVSVGYQTTVFINNGSGLFSSKLTLPSLANTTCVITGDFDGDTWTDFAGANYLENSAAVSYNSGSMGFGDQRFWGVGFAPNSVAAGDLDGDGRLDLLAVSSQLSQDTATVVLNDGNRHFVARRDYAVPGSAYGLDVGDLNRDGFPDVAVAVYVSNQDIVRVYYGTAGGELSAPYDVENFGNNIPTDVQIADLNADGWLDMVASIFSPGNRIRVWINRGDGTFGPSVSYTADGNPSGVAIGDLNGDAKPDIVCTNGAQLSNKVSIYLNAGNGTFHPQILLGTLLRPSDAVIADFDRDGDQDFAVTHGGSTSVLLFRNSGSATFSPQAYNAGEAQSGGLVSDFNGDGWPDLLLGGGSLRVLPNYAGNFGAAIGSPILAGYATAADLNRDGILDGVGTNGVTNHVNFGPGSAAGTFTLGGTMPSGYDVGKVACADVDHDGFLDLLTANGGRSISVFANRTLGAPCRPDSLALVLGRAEAGGLAEVLLSDDRKFTARPARAPKASEHPVTIVIEGTSPTQAPSSLSVATECRSSHAGIGQVISLWDWPSGIYRQVDSRLLKPTDVNTVVTASGDLQRFVQQGTRRVRAQLGFRSLSPISSQYWTVSVDQAGWRIEP